MKFLQSEQAFLEVIDTYFPNTHPGMPVGRGDDCALITCPGSLCVTTDLFVENVHFRRSYFDPEHIGHKSLAVNLSDSAAMGARPLGFSLAIVAPPDVPQEFWEGFFKGMGALAARYDLPLTGGDLSSGDTIMVSITLWGAAEHKVMLRRQSRMGDVLFVVGDIGLARAGLMLLEGKEAAEAFGACTTQHLMPEPMISQGIILASTEGVRGLMDISDGLAQDLPRFLGPDLGADLEFGTENIHREVLHYCAEHRLNPMRFCLKGGEDYALLGSADAAAFSVLCKRVPGIWKLGRVTEQGIYINGEGLPAQGFDHFCQVHS